MSQTIWFDQDLLLLFHHLRLALPRGSSVTGFQTAMEQFYQALHGNSTLCFVSASTLGPAYEQYVLFLKARASKVAPPTTVHPVTRETMPILDTKWCPCCYKTVAGLTADCCFKCKRFHSKGKSCAAEPDGEDRAVCVCVRVYETLWEGGAEMWIWAHCLESSSTHEREWWACVCVCVCVC